VQICDGEPEGNDHYDWRLSGGAVVTSYWSVMDQAFIVPDDSPQRVLFTPQWNSSGWMGDFISLQRGILYDVQTPMSPGVKTNTMTTIDTQVQAYAIAGQNGASHQLYDLSTTGQVNAYNGSSWSSITGSNTVASQLLAQPSGDLFMLAVNSGVSAAQVWHYAGSGTSWTPLTDPTSFQVVDSIAVTPTGVYMLALKGALYGVWQYSGSGTKWTPLTGIATGVSTIATAGGQLYMMARNGGLTDQVWQYDGSGTSWSPITGSNTQVAWISSVNDVLYMQATNDGGHWRMWQYGLEPNVWTRISGTNLAVEQVVIQDDVEIMTIAANGTAPSQVWEYAGTDSGWTALTGTNMTVYWLGLTYWLGQTSDLLTMDATDGGPARYWTYSGTPLLWM
jgi:hypothetical protein